MTREEALRLLEEFKNCITGIIPWGKYVTPIDMAITALKSQRESVQVSGQVDDLISRRVAMDKLFDAYHGVDALEEYFWARQSGIGDAYKIIDELPSVPSEPRANFAESDFVSRSYLLAEYDKRHRGPKGEARKIIEEAPSIQPEIVRCKDCNHSEKWYGDKYMCFLWDKDGIDVFDDGYCNYGRKENEQ